MAIFNETKELVRKEKYYTARILKNLMVIEKNKLYSDRKFSSLFKYLIKELGYSESESIIRVNAVRLMLKSKVAEKKIVAGELSLSNAATANRVIDSNISLEIADKVVEMAATTSTREFNKFISLVFRKPRQENLVLPEYILDKMDKVRESYGDVSNFELLQILLEEKLNDPGVVRHLRKCTPRVSRGIPKSVKAKVYTGVCANCSVRYGLEYDHKKKFSHGGLNSADNIQILCRNCNQRKEIISRYGKETN